MYGASLHNFRSSRKILHKMKNKNKIKLIKILMDKEQFVTMYKFILQKFVNMIRLTRYGR